MSIQDMIKSSILEGFSTNISIPTILISLLLAFVLGVYILVIYRLTFKGTVVSASFCTTLLMITMISSMIVLTITSNLALSLGMVGALSIVRFRTAIKDPNDTIYIFWAVAVGITAGAGFYWLAIIASLLIGILTYVMSILGINRSAAYLLVIRTQSQDAVRSAEATFAHYHIKYNLASKIRNSDYIEVVYEVKIGKQEMRIVDTLSEIPNIGDVSMVDCRNTVV